MIVSFALTEAEFLAGKKTCSRRRRWKPEHAKHWKAGTIHQAWSKVPYVKGARLLGVIRATHDAYLERLGDMPIADLEAEGGMCATVEDFITLIDGTPDERLYVVRFEVVSFANLEPGARRCVCGKVIHLTRELAEQALVEHFERPVTRRDEHPRRAERLEVYRCVKGGHWHFGHRPTNARRLHGRRRRVTRDVFEQEQK